MKCGFVKIIAIVLISAFVSLFAQEGSADIAPTGGGRGYFAVGGAMPDIEALNSCLEKDGYGTFPDKMISLGGGGYVMGNKIVFGGEGHSFMDEKEAGENYTATISGGYGFFNIGYVLFSTRAVTIFPLIGVGGGGIDLSIVENGSHNFSEIMDDPKRATHLSASGWLLNAALQTDCMISLGSDEKGSGRIILGLSIGYVLDPKSGNWSFEETEIAGGPDAGITGPYAHLLVGMGGTSK